MFAGWREAHDGAMTTTTTTTTITTGAATMARCRRVAG
jgi:hypothetical protein